MGRRPTLHPTNAYAAPTREKAVTIQLPLVDADTATAIWTTTQPSIIRPNHLANHLLSTQSGWAI